MGCRLCMLPLLGSSLMIRLTMIISSLSSISNQGKVHGLPGLVTSP